MANRSPLRITAVEEAEEIPMVEPAMHTAPAAAITGDPARMML